MNFIPDRYPALEDMLEQTALVDRAALDILMQFIDRVNNTIGKPVKATMTADEQDAYDRVLDDFFCHNPKEVPHG